VKTLNVGIQKLVSRVLEENKQLNLEQTMEIVGLLEDPMFDSLIMLNRRAWESVTSVFSAFDLAASCSQADKLL